MKFILYYYFIMSDFYFQHQNRAKTIESGKNMEKSLKWQPWEIEPQTLFEIYRIEYAGIQSKPSGYIFKGEMHSFYEIVLVTKGEVLISAGENVYTVKSGHAIIHAPMVFHTVRCTDSPAEIMLISLTIKGDALKKICSMPIPVTVKEAELFKTAVECFSLPTGASSEIQEGIAASELFLLNLYKRKSEIHLSGDNSAEKYKSILKYLNANIGKRLYLADISAALNMSVSSLKKAFAQYSDIGIIAYFCKQKIAAATAMLESGKSATEIAALLGFSSTDYFLYCFKKETGLTPKQYKNKIKKLP